MADSSTDNEWRRWVEAYSSRFLLFARQRARSEPDAQDLVQEAVVEARQRHGPDTPPPPALVFATIHRRAIDLARREDRRAQRERAASEPTPEAWFDSTPEDRELSLWAQSALNTLPETLREVLVLKLWGDLTFAQIAETLGIPANTAASRYRYALDALRRRTHEVLT